MAGLENSGRTPTRWRRYRAALNAHVLPRVGNLALQELQVSEFGALYAPSLTSGGLSHTSVHNVQAAMNKFAEATGRSFVAEMMAIERLAGGRLVERWEIPDNASVMHN